MVSGAYPGFYSVYNPQNDGPDAAGNFCHYLFGLTRLRLGDCCDFQVPGKIDLNYAFDTDRPDNHHLDNGGNYESSLKK